MYYLLPIGQRLFFLVENKNGYSAMDLNFVCFGTLNRELAAYET